MDLKKIVGTVLVGAILLYPSNLNSSSLEEKLQQHYQEVDQKFNIQNKEYVILIDGKNQELYLTSETDGVFLVHKKYSVSTGKHGFSNRNLFGKTPFGVHKIKRKYGNNEPLGTIFIGRESIRRIATIYQNKDDSISSLITTRIIWLEGTEEINQETNRGYIYIHGTNKEGLIGSPVTGGCIRMKNEEIIELYKLVEEGTYRYYKIKKKKELNFY